MNDHTISAIVGVLMAIIGVAILAEIVSQKANTGSVFGALGSGISQMICVAMSPVTGKSCGATGAALIPKVDSTITFGGQVPQ